MNVLITSGGTKVPIDRVRHIANMSSGTFGSKIALEALKNKDIVNFFYAEKTKTPFSFTANMLHDGAMLKMNNVIANFNKYYNQKTNNYNERTYTTFQTYMNGLKDYITETKPDVVILAAAVSDYGVENYVNSKIRSNNSLQINLTPYPKVISKIKEWHPTCYLVGFKLLVDSTEAELIQNSYKSIHENGCDMVVANDLADIKNNDHKLLIVKKNSFQKFNTDKNDENYLARIVVEQYTKDKKL